MYRHLSRNVSSDWQTKYSFKTKDDIVQITQLIGGKKQERGKEKRGKEERGKEERGKEERGKEGKETKKRDVT
jgi:hypothetical protein